MTNQYPPISSFHFGTATPVVLNEKSKPYGLLDLALIEERTKLLDLLTGRVLRQYADKSLQNAIDIQERRKRYQSFGAVADPLVDCLVSTIEEYLDNAANMETIAIKAEQGCILWGGRYNRCGFQPKTEEK